MPITNDRELERATVQAGELLQQIADYCTRDGRHLAARVRFPRGFILTANAYRLTIPFIRDEHTKTNLSYSLMTLDVLRWLGIRTNLTGIALEMIMKEAICLLGSICECLTVRRGVEGLGRNTSFAKRIQKLVEMQVIEEGTRDDLAWLWDVRCREHLMDLDHAEFRRYGRADCNRAITAYCELRDALAERYGN
jgi:hypothetical protein